MISGSPLASQKTRSNGSSVTSQGSSGDGSRAMTGLAAPRDGLSLSISNSAVRSWGSPNAEVYGNQIVRARSAPSSDERQQPVTMVTIFISGNITTSGDRRRAGSSSDLAPRSVLKKKDKVLDDLPSRELTNPSWHCDEAPSVVLLQRVYPD